MIETAGTEQLGGDVVVEGLVVDGVCLTIKSPVLRQFGPLVRSLDGVEFGWLWGRLESLGGAAPAGAEWSGEAVMSDLFDAIRRAPDALGRFVPAVLFSPSNEAATGVQGFEAFRDWLLDRMTIADVLTFVRELFGMPEVLKDVVSRAVPAPGVIQGTTEIVVGEDASAAEESAVTAPVAGPGPVPADPGAAPVEAVTP